MSAKLLGLGFSCDMGTPCRKLVLLKLIDACEDDGTRIFPAVATIARAAQCTARHVQRELATFVAAGLLEVVRAGGHGPGNTTEYRMDIGMLRRIEAIGWNAAAAGRGVEGDGLKGDMMSPLDEGDIGDAGRATSATPKGDMMSHPTPQETPPMDPSQGEREARAPDSISGDDVGLTLSAFLDAYPTGLADDEDPIRPVWAGLSDDDRRAAIAGARIYADEVRRSAGRTKPIGGLKYLRQRKWERLPGETLASAAQRPATVYLPPFDRPWCLVIHRLTAAATTPEHVRLISVKIAMAVSTGSGIQLPAAEAPSAQDCAALVQVFSASADFELWHAWFRGRGVHLPRRDRQWWWFPSRRPEPVHDPGRATPGQDETVGL